MSVRVRLTRVGSKKNPIWRVVVSDQRSPRDGRFIETIGHYNPQTEPSTIVIDAERFQHWVSRGAQPTNTVKQLVKAHAKGVAGGTSTGSAGVSQAPVAVAEPEAEEAPADIVEARAEAPETEPEAPASEPAETEAPPDEPEAPAEPAEGDAAVE
jgi:small subunit ribosomal protein S16